MQPLRGCVYGYGPEEADEEKYDETAASMIALMRYGSGFPWYRLEGLQGEYGHPSTSGDTVRDRQGNRRSDSAGDELFFGQPVGEANKPITVVLNSTARLKQ